MFSNFQPQFPNRPIVGHGGDDMGAVLLTDAGPDPLAGLELGLVMQGVWTIEAGRMHGMPAGEGGGGAAGPAVALFDLRFEPLDLYGEGGKRSENRLDVL